MLFCGTSFILSLFTFVMKQKKKRSIAGMKPTYFPFWGNALQFFLTSLQTILKLLKFIYTLSNKCRNIKKLTPFIYPDSKAL